MKLMYMQYNNLRLVPVWYTEAVCIHCFRLDLRNNYLTSLTEFTFRGLTGVRYLFLTNNRIYHIERRALRHLHQLLYLVLRGNPLSDVARLHFHSPSSLSYIDMSECGLTTVPRGLPASLRYVQLRRNNLTALHADAFTQCPQVNILVLDENKIHSVHNGTFTSMSHLQQVCMRRTPYTHIRGDLKYCTVGSHTTLWAMKTRQSIHSM